MLKLEHLAINITNYQNDYEIIYHLCHCDLCFQLRF